MLWPTVQRAGGNGGEPGDAEFLHTLVIPDAVLCEELDRFIVEADPTDLVGLGVLVSFFPPRCVYARRISKMPVVRWRSSHWSASTSPRRTPVTMTSQTSVPQSASCSQAASTIRAACSGDGGCGFGVGR